MNLNTTEHVTEGCRQPNYKGVRAWTCTHHYQASSDEPVVHLAGGGANIVYAIWISPEDIPINIRGPKAVPSEKWDEVKAVIDENFGVFPSEDEVKAAVNAARSLLASMESKSEA